MPLMYSPRGSGNATVPNDAPIQPGQAFVNAYVYLVEFGTPGDMYFRSVGMTHFNTGAYDFTTALIQQFDFSENTLPASDVNAILAAIRASGRDPIYLNLSGVNMADPTGQGIIDVAYLEGLGWEVYTHSNPP